MDRKTRLQTAAGLVWLALMSCIAVAANATPARVDVGPEQIGLLELYTSEGCSSCPPADRFFNDLADSPDIFETLVPVAFHVDYWNYLGWRDRFASADYSRRQRDHARAGRARTVYTPGFFYNGSEWRQFFGGDLNEFPEPVAGGWLGAALERDTLNIAFRPLADAVKPHYATVALLGFGLQTEVRAGENRGRTLSHDFVVLATAEMRLASTAYGFEGAGGVPATDIAAQRYALALWVSDSPGGPPLQAAGFWLPPDTAPQ